MKRVQAFFVKTARLAIIVLPLLSLASALACYYTGRRTAPKILEIVFLTALVPVFISALLVASFDLSERKNRISRSMAIPSSEGPLPPEHEKRMGEELRGFLAVLLICGVYFVGAYFVVGAVWG